MWGTCIPCNPADGGILNHKSTSVQKGGVQHCKSGMPIGIIPGPRARKFPPSQPAKKKVQRLSNCAAFDSRTGDKRWGEMEEYEEAADACVPLQDIRRLSWDFQ